MKCMSVACDGEGCDAVYTGDTWNIMWSEARQAGWRRKTGSIPAAHFCPLCVEQLRRQQKARRVMTVNATSKRYADLAIQEATNFLNSDLPHSNHILATECVVIAKQMRDAGLLFQAKMYAICGITLATAEITHIKDAIAMYHPTTIDNTNGEELYDADLERYIP